MFKPALTVGLTANRDPDTHYSLMDKVRMAGYPALFRIRVTCRPSAQELAAAQGLKANETGAIFLGAASPTSALSLGIATFGEDAYALCEPNIASLSIRLEHQRSSPAPRDCTSKRTKGDRGAKN